MNYQLRLHFSFLHTCSTPWKSELQSRTCMWIFQRLEEPLVCAVVYRMLADQFLTTVIKNQSFKLILINLPACLRLILGIIRRPNTCFKSNATLYILRRKLFLRYDKIQQVIKTETISWCGNFIGSVLFIFFFLRFILGRAIERGKDRLNLPSISLLPKLVRLELWLIQARNSILLFWVGRSLKHWSRFPVLLQGYWQGCELEVEHPGLELLLWNAMPSSEVA